LRGSRVAVSTSYGSTIAGKKFCYHLANSTSRTNYDDGVDAVSCRDRRKVSDIPAHVSTGPQGRISCSLTRIALRVLSDWGH